MLFGVVLVVIALVGVVDMLFGVVLMAVALVDVVDMAGLVAVMLVTIALVDVMNVLASVVFVLVALVLVVGGSYHFGHLTLECTERVPGSPKAHAYKVYQKPPVVKGICRKFPYKQV